MWPYNAVVFSYLNDTTGVDGDAEIQYAENTSII